MRARLAVIFLWLSAAAAPGWAQAPGSNLARDREFAQSAQLEPDLQHGEELFQTCAACHGADGRGTEDGEIPAEPRITFDPSAINIYADSWRVGREA